MGDCIDWEEGGVASEVFVGVGDRRRGRGGVCVDEREGTTVMEGDWKREVLIEKLEVIVGGYCFIAPPHDVCSWNKLWVIGGRKGG